jgi:hypothetical protein
MTFKHTQFGDSVTMRSFEKVAQEKGLIKNDPMKKIASVPDLMPSSNFMENVLKLCSGLRHSGFNKYADELETAFVTYKQADKSYNISNEKGEDLIEAAHPEGGHQMEDVEGDAYVEDILEKHLKMLEVSNKQPSAKMASGKDILKAVKLVLSQDTNTLVASKLQEAKNHANTIIKLIQEGGTPDEQGAVQLGRIASLRPLVATLATTPFDANKALQTLDSSMSNIQYVDPQERAAGQQQTPRKYTFSMSNYTIWKKMEGEFAAIKNLIGEVSKLSQGDADLLAKMKKLLTTLQSYRSLLNDEGFTPQDRIDGNKEIDGYVKTLQNWQSVFAGLDPEEKGVQSPRYQAKLEELSSRVKQLYQEITAQ